MPSLITPQLDGFLTFGLGVDGGSSPSIAVSDDLDFLAGLIDTIAVELDANRLGGISDQHGDVVPNYQPVAGQSLIAARVIIRRPKNLLVDDRITSDMEWVVLTGSGIVWDVNYRLVYFDPIFNRNRYGYVLGRTVNAHEMNHHWVTTCTEHPS